MGEYVNEHFLSSYQKVGTFKIVNGRKQGGNIVTYFCLTDGTVLDIIAGPVDAKKFLRAARWVVETRKTALTENKPKASGPPVRIRDDIDFGSNKPVLAETKPKRTNAAHAIYFRKAHAERFLEEHSSKSSWNHGEMNVPAQLPTHMTKEAQTQWLLASYPTPKIKDIYKIVYQDILKERISNLPVDER